MNFKYLCIAAAITGIIPLSASAQTVESTITASNGVDISANIDTFAGRYEYSAPVIKSGDGTILVANVRRGNVKSDTHIQGFIIYNGEWRYYNGALFRGGEEANFVSTGRDVGRCHSSRYSASSCTLTESFSIRFGEGQIAKFAQDGILQIQVRGRAGVDPILFNIPVSYIDAVNEVAATAN